MSIKELGIRVHAQTETGDFMRKVGEVEGGIRRLQSLSIKGIRSGGIIDPKDMREAQHHIGNMNQEIDRLTRLFDAATGRADKFQKKIDGLTTDIKRMHDVGGKEITIQKTESQIDSAAEKMVRNDQLAQEYKREIDRLKAMLTHQKVGLDDFTPGEDREAKKRERDAERDADRARREQEREDKAKEREGKNKERDADRARREQEREQRRNPSKTVGQTLTGWMPDSVRRYGGQALGLLGVYNMYQHLQTGLNNSANLHKQAADMGIRMHLKEPEDFNTFRDGLYKKGYGLGFKGAESMGMADTMLSTTGYTDPAMLGRIQEFTRAYGMDGGQASQQFGQHFQQGAFAYGPEGAKKYAEVMASYLDRSKMQGRAVEAMESTAQMLERWGTRNPGLVDSTGLMAVQTLFNQTGLEGFRGARGSQFMGMLDQSMAQPGNPAVENGLLTAYGWGKDKSYFEAVNRMEDGASPENLRDAMNHIKKNYGGDKEQMLLALRGFFPGVTVKQGKALMGMDFNNLDNIKQALGEDGGRIDTKVDNWKNSQGGQLYLLDARTDELQTLVGDKLLPTLTQLQQGLQDLADWAIAHPVLAAGAAGGAYALWNMPMGGGVGGGAPSVPGAPGIPGLPSGVASGMVPGGGPGTAPGGSGGGGWLSTGIGVAVGQAISTGIRAVGSWAVGAATASGLGAAAGTGALIAAPVVAGFGGLYAASKIDDAAERTRLEKGAQGWFSLQDEAGGLRGEHGPAPETTFQQISKMQNMFTGDITGITTEAQQTALKKLQVDMLALAKHNIQQGSDTLFGTDDPIAFMRKNGLDDIIAGHLDRFAMPGQIKTGVHQNLRYVNTSDIAGSPLMSNEGTDFIANSNTKKNADLFGFTAQKLDDVNKMSITNGMDPKLLLAILQHEGTGSFNTLSPTRLQAYHAQGKFRSVSPAGDGENGPNPVWNEDLTLAVNLIKQEQGKWELMTEAERARYKDFLEFLNKRYATDKGWSTQVRDLLKQLGGDQSRMFFNPNDVSGQQAMGLSIEQKARQIYGEEREKYRLQEEQGYSIANLPELKPVAAIIEDLKRAAELSNAIQDYRAGERAGYVRVDGTITVNVNGPEMTPRAEIELEKKLRRAAKQAIDENNYTQTYSRPNSTGEPTPY